MRMDDPTTALARASTPLLRGPCRAPTRGWPTSAVPCQARGDSRYQQEKCGADPLGEHPPLAASGPQSAALPHFRIGAGHLAVRQLDPEYRALLADLPPVGLGIPARPHRLHAADPVPVRAPARRHGRGPPAARAHDPRHPGVPRPRLGGARDPGLERVRGGVGLPLGRLRHRLRQRHRGADAPVPRRRHRRRACPAAERDRVPLRAFQSRPHARADDRRPAAAGAKRGVVLRHQLADLRCGDRSLPADAIDRYTRKGTSTPRGSRP